MPLVALPEASGPVRAWASSSAVSFWSTLSSVGPGSAITSACTATEHSVPKTVYQLYRAKCAEATDALTREACSALAVPTRGTLHPDRDTRDRPYCVDGTSRAPGDRRAPAPAAARHCASRSSLPACMRPQPHNMRHFRSSHSQMSQSVAQGSQNMHIQNCALALPRYPFPHRNPVDTDA
eukprot:COSAG02_NODE_5222_length_4527_cov_134.379630_4_plen_180_part_00